LLRNWATIGRSTLTESWRTLRWVAGQLGRVGWTGMRMRLSDVVTPELTGMRDENGGFVNGTLLNRIYNKVYETVALGRVPTVGILVRAKITSDAEKPYRELDPNLGWSEAFAGGLHVIETSGDHMSMIEADDNLDALGRHVNKKLDLVSPGTTGSDSDRTLKAAS